MWQVAKWFLDFFWISFGTSDCRGVRRATLIAMSWARTPTVPAPAALTDTRHVSHRVHMVSQLYIVCTSLRSRWRFPAKNCPLSLALRIRDLGGSRTGPSWHSLLNLTCPCADVMSRCQVQDKFCLYPPFSLWNRFRGQWGDHNSGFEAQTYASICLNDLKYQYVN